MRVLKSQLEGEVEIDYMTKSSYASIVQSNPHIHKVITIDKSVFEQKEWLLSQHYDYVIDLHNNLRSRQVKRLVKSLSFTVDKRNIAKWLYVNTKRELLPIGHFVSRCFDAVAPLGVKDDQRGLDFNIPQDDIVSDIPVSHKDGFIAYAIGGQELGKILPTEQAIMLCQMINKPIVLLGGPEDKERGGIIQKAVGNLVWNACGAFSLYGSASLVEKSEAVITHDTGLMHIASALHKKVVSLWFATTPQIGFAPWQPGEGSAMIEASCRKRPTSKLGNRGFKDGCVFNINLEEIKSAVS